MATPAPNSPEALKAARKIRDLFFAIAALNLVLIGVVMCSHRDSKPAPKDVAPATPASSQPAPK